MLARVVSHMSEELVDAFASANTIALDAEGVELGRFGSITIVQIATASQCFLLDVLDLSKEDPLVCWLRRLLENSSIVKVIHDCRKDSDALCVHLGIKLTCVHDTQCWHKAITGTEANKSLNDTLQANRIQTNAFRDCSIYDQNPTFWASRPITDEMIRWASGDVTSMLELYATQLDCAHGMEAIGQALSEHNIVALREARTDFVVVRNPGRFIGRRGENLRRLELRTDTQIYGKGPKSDRRFIVYYHSRNGLNTVRQHANN
jgi:hypothetical protein